MIKTNWHKRFIDLAHYISQWSKYPGRTVGAVIIDDRHTVVSMGYNGSPRGCNDLDETKFNNPKTKYFYAEHAERNAIYNATTPLTSKTIYSTLFPCAACARAIIQCGITRLVTYAPNFSDTVFGEQFKAAFKMFSETGVEVFYLDHEYQLINSSFLVIDRCLEETKTQQNLDKKKDCSNCTFNQPPYDHYTCDNCDENYNRWLPIDYFK